MATRVVLCATSDVSEESSSPGVHGSQVRHVRGVTLFIKKVLFSNFCGRHEMPEAPRVPPPITFSLTSHKLLILGIKGGYGYLQKGIL